MKPAGIRSLEDCAHTLSQVERFALPDFDNGQGPLEILVPSNKMQCRSSFHVCRVWRAGITSGMLWEIGKGVYTVSPEMLFVQMAHTISFTELLLFGMELCGTYTITNEEEMRFVTAEPATTRHSGTSPMARTRRRKADSCSHSAFPSIWAATDYRSRA